MSEVIISSLIGMTVGWSAKYVFLRLLMVLILAVVIYLYRLDTETRNEWIFILVWCFFSFWLAQQAVIDDAEKPQATPVDNIRKFALKEDNTDV